MSPCCMLLIYVFLFNVQVLLNINIKNVVSICFHRSCNYSRVFWLFYGHFCLSFSDRSTLGHLDFFLIIFFLGGGGVLYSSI